MLRREKGKGKVSGGKRREMGKVLVWERLAGSSLLRAFKGGDFRGGPRGGSPQNIHQLSRRVPSGSWSPPIGWCQSGSLVNAAGPEVSHGLSCLVLLLLGAWS